MTRSFPAAALCFAAVLAAGCATVQITSDLEGQSLAEGRQSVAHVHAQNWGVYILNWLPVLCGNPHDTGLGTILFSDRTRVEDAVGMVLSTSKGLAATATLGLTSHTETAWIPLTPFWIRRCQASGNACK